MNTYQRIQSLLADNDTIMDQQPDDDKYIEWVELSKAVCDTVNGFNVVLKAANQCREAQKAYFKARKGGLMVEANNLLVKSKELEKDLDELLKKWTHEMTKPGSMQTNLFE